ncbi:DUF6705 family protein [Wenyingzhuangia sp. IMCC45533]
MKAIYILLLLTISMSCFSQERTYIIDNYSGLPNHEQGNNYYKSSPKITGHLVGTWEYEDARQTLRIIIDTKKTKDPYGTNYFDMYRTFTYYSLRDNSIKDINSLDDWDFTEAGTSWIDKDVVLFISGARPYVTRFEMEIVEDDLALVYMYNPTYAFGENTIVPTKLYLRRISKDVTFDNF